MRAFNGHRPHPAWRKAGESQIAQWGSGAFSRLALPGVFCISRRHSLDWHTLPDGAKIAGGQDCQIYSWLGATGVYAAHILFCARLYTPTLSKSDTGEWMNPSIHPSINDRSIDRSMDRSADPSMIHPSIHDPYIDPWMNILIHGSSVYHRRQDYIKNGYILYIILTLSIRTGVHTNCAAHRMHSCCNPLLHDMLDLTASAVSCVEPVQSRLQAAAAEVAVAKLLLVCLVCLCCMTLCWVFSLSTTIPRYCVGGGSTCIELYSTAKPRSQLDILRRCPVVTIRRTYGRVRLRSLCTWVCVPTTIANRYCGGTQTNVCKDHKRREPAQNPVVCLLHVCRSPNDE